MEVWRGLRHPNVLPFIGAVTLGPKLYMVSPWMENGDLRRFLKRTLGANYLKLLLQIAEGLQFLHTLDPPIIHGDLKGPNILISGTGDACIADFGLSHRLVDGVSKDYSSPWHNAGNTRWQAPEILKAETAEDGKRTTCSDVFAFGRVIIEVFTMEVPFSEISSNLVVGTKVLAGKNPMRPKGLGVRLRGLDDRMWGLMVDCCRVQADQRPSIQSVVTRLRAIIDSQDESSGLAALLARVFS